MKESGNLTTLYGEYVPRAPPCIKSIYYFGMTAPRVPMSPSRRAKQFAPLDALKGLKEVIAENERIQTPRQILSEDAIAEINAQLMTLKPSNVATAVYYCVYAQECHQITGAV